jgi:YD repeat-containing protein
MKKYENWYIDNKLHRDNNPAKIEWNEQGHLIKREWYQNNKRHRENGPAVMKYYDNGTRIYQYYYLNGDPIRKDKFIN